MSSTLSQNSPETEWDDLQNRTLLYCVGAQKAGTSWLHSYFGKHPEIHVPACKELHYFDNLMGPEKGNVHKQRQTQLTRKRPAGFLGTSKTKMKFPSREYSQALIDMHECEQGDHSSYKKVLCDGMDDQNVVADITPSYSVLGAPELEVMLNVSPNTRFLYILRDPIERMWSSLRMIFVARKKAHSKFPNDFPDPSLYEMAHKLVHKGAHKRIVRRSDYARYLTALVDVVPQERRHIVFYEELFSQDVLDQISGFLGVSPLTADLKTRVREGDDFSLPDDIRHELRNLLRPQYQYVSDMFGDRVPKTWDMKALDSKSNGAVG